jgi:hypothetical protein
MSLFGRILSVAAHAIPDAGIDCILIGGFAVNHYGYSRSTLDVDFMILADDLDRVRRVMVDAGFTNVSVHENVVFFSSGEGEPRVDFLRVNEETMRKLMANAVQVDVRGHTIRVPALRDLLAMKTFAPPPFPPHVSMDAYLTFVEESFRAQKPEQIRRQKHLDERIEKAFDMAACSHAISATGTTRLPHQRKCQPPDRPG